MKEVQEETIPEGVALIGMAGQFPGASTVEALWQNICEGTESIIRLAPEEDYALQIDPGLRDHPQYVPAGAFLPEIDRFDASFFGYTPREAQLMDPQHRLFLECAWEALERAGYDAHQYDGRISIYAGSGMNSYMLAHVFLNQDLVKTVGVSQLLISNEKDFLATRVAYKLGLRGPAITVQTACSTSLTAVSLAFQSLVSYQSDIALAGGVSLPALQKQGYLYEPGGIASPDGHCRAFDADARGTVVGGGLGVVVLKRLEDALQDGDQIYAVIKGVAMNNDGDTKIGFTAPSIAGQAEVITEALALADVDPATIGYIETHGTGTYLGDPIEVAALNQAFRAKTQQTHFCAIGSIKTNIGHLDTAAGIAGLIKTCFALKYGLLPPSLNFSRPNPQIDFARSPFFVNTRLAPWPRGETPRRAGVSSFGIGGTNVHVVLEEAPERVKTRTAHATPEILILSAKTSTALDTAAQQLSTYLQHHPELALADVAYTLQVGRRAFPHRLMLVCQNLAEASRKLQTREAEGVFSSVVEPGDHTCIFLFSGQGAPSSGSGKQLYDEEPTYRQWIDYCAARLLPLLNTDLRDYLFLAEHAAPSVSQRTLLAQCALFVTQYTMARLLETRGIRPAAMLGQDLGEYTAACLAGVFSLEDALMLLVARGHSEHAAHLRHTLHNLQLSPPQIPYISSMTGTWITEAQACSSAYWTQQMQATLSFSDSLHVVSTLPHPLLLEVGPVQASKATFGSMLPVIPSMRHPLDTASERAVFLSALGKLWLQGLAVDLAYPETRTCHRVLLPTYPFERTRHWLEAPSAQAAQAPATPITELAETPMLSAKTAPDPATLLARTQRQVRAIWQEYLGSDAIDLHANFFELGGHSLLAIRLVARLREVFDIELSETILYDKQTIAELSQYIVTSKNTSPIRLVPVSRTLPLPASWKQQWMWARAQHCPADADRENLAIGWELHGQLDTALFEQSVHILAQRHETLRTSFVQRDNRLFQVIAPTLTISLPIIDLTRVPEEEKTPRLLQLATEQEQTPFSMSAAPLWRMTLFLLDKERSAWILVAHRSIWDGISTHRVQEELQHILSALRQQHAPELPPLPIQFADFAYWEQQHFQGDVLQEHLAYWRKKLPGEPAPLRLPTDRPRRHGYALSAARDWHIAGTAAQGLRTLGQQQGATLFMTMLAGLNILCSYYTRQTTILIETSFSNRDQPELLPLVGPLTNIVPLCVRLDGNPTFSTLLREVRTTVIEAMTHRDLHFSRVLAELLPDIYQQYNPLGRILIALYENPETFPTLPDLTYQQRLWFRRATNDLYISLVDHQSSIQVICEYDTHLFLAETIVRMMADYFALLARIVADPESTLNDLIHWLEQRAILPSAHIE